MAAAPDRARTCSGRLYTISYGEQRVSVAEQGAAVREYRVGERDVFQPCADLEFLLGYHGCVLVPWPNRLRDGRYVFDGVEQQVAITEPSRMTALHGLSPWQPWTVVAHEADRVVLRWRLLPSPGYPFELDTTVEYALGADGLRVRATSTNVGPGALPYGVGFHPYLSTGGAPLDACTLRIDADRRIVPDGRLLPIGEQDVAGTPYDFRAPRAVGALQLDDAFSALRRGADGLSWLRLSAPDGATAAIWADRSCDFWQLCSGDGLPAHLARFGVAAEPMSAAPDAFRSGRGLARIEPGESVTTVWGAALL